MKLLLCACDSGIDYRALNESIIVLKHYNPEIKIDVLIPKSQYLQFFGNPALSHVSGHVYLEDIVSGATSLLRDIPKKHRDMIFRRYDRVIDCSGLTADGDAVGKYIELWKKNKFAVGDVSGVYGLIQNTGDSFWIEDGVFIERASPLNNKKHYSQAVANLLQRGLRVFSNSDMAGVIKINDDEVARALLRFKYIIATSDTFIRPIHGNSFHRILYYRKKPVIRGPNILVAASWEPLLPYLDIFLKAGNDLTDLRAVVPESTAGADLYTNLTDAQFVQRQFADYCRREPTITEAERCTELLRSMPRSRMNELFAYCDESLAQEAALFFPPAPAVQPMQNSGGLRVAVLLTGHLRTFEQTYPTIRDNIVSPLGADVYVHTWTGLGRQKSAGSGGLVSDETESADIGLARQIMPQIISISAEDNEKFLAGAKMRNEKPLMFGTAEGLRSVIYTAKPIYIESQLYSSARALQLMEDGERNGGFKYDLVIKMRSDLRAFSGLPSVGSLQSDDLWVPTPPSNSHCHPLCWACVRGRHEGLHGAEVCDIYAYGGRSAMGHYLGLWNDLESVYSRMKAENDINIKRPGTLHGSCNGFVTVPVLHNSANYRLNLFYPERILRLHLQGWRLLPGTLECAVVR